MRRSRDEVSRLFRVDVDRTANHPPLPSVFPDQLAPVIRMSGGDRIMQPMLWGFPPPPNLGNRPVTNVRNPASPYWRGWLEKRFRCLVPVTSFCEYQDGSKTPTWFALGRDRPVFAFAGIWRPWTGVRGSKAERQALLDRTGSERQEHLVFSFLTTEPNALMRPVHAKAMPVILTGEHCDRWLDAEPAEALALQRPAPDDQLQIVACGPREDSVAQPGAQGLLF